MNIQIRTQEIIKENDYWLKFICYVPEVNNNKKYYIRYCGTEIDTDLSIDEKTKEKLLTKLQILYSYGPFNKPTYNKIFKEYKNFRVE